MSWHLLCWWVSVHCTPMTAHLCLITTLCWWVSVPPFSFGLQAASDNVIRAGCTPKFKDVDVLCDNLTYTMSSADSKKFRGKSQHASHHRTPPSHHTIASSH